MGAQDFISVADDEAYRVAALTSFFHFFSVNKLVLRAKHPSRFPFILNKLVLRIIKPPSYRREFCSV